MCSYFGTFCESKRIHRDAELLKVKNLARNFYFNLRFSDVMIFIIDYWCAHYNSYHRWLICMSMIHINDTITRVQKKLALSISLHFLVLYSFFSPKSYELTVTCGYCGTL